MRRVALIILGVSATFLGAVDSKRLQGNLRLYQTRLIQPDAATANDANLAQQTLKESKKLEDEESKAIGEILNIEEQLAAKQYEEESGQPSIPDGPLAPKQPEGHGSMPPESPEVKQNAESRKKRQQEIDEIEKKMERVNTNQTAKIQEEETKLKELEGKNVDDMLKAAGLPPQMAEGIAGIASTDKEAVHGTQ